MKILVSLDGSPRAEGVLSYAVSLARSTGAELVLFRAWDVPSELTLAWPESDADLEAALRKEATTYLEAQAQTVPRELLGEVRIARGSPAQTVCSEARAANSDLIVIGSHGFGGWDRLLGTTAAKIVNLADRPVLVVRPLPQTARSGQ